MKNNHIFIPIDFNSFSNIKDGEISLSDYYIDYAFYSEGLKPSEGMKVTFYNNSWKKDKLADEIMCLDAIIKNTQHEFGSWSAEFEGKIYTIVGAPKRNYFSGFIGANTRLHTEKGRTVVQKLGIDPKKDKLDGISAFVFPPGTQMPDFSKIVGMNVKELAEFFMFKDLG